MLVLQLRDFSRINIGILVRNNIIEKHLYNYGLITMFGKNSQPNHKLCSCLIAR